MSMPLDLAYYQMPRKGRDLRTISPNECRDDMIYFRTYRDVEYYKRIDNKFVFARKLLPREVDDFMFNNGQSFRGCTIVEKLR